MSEYYELLPPHPFPTDPDQQMGQAPCQEDGNPRCPVCELTPFKPPINTTPRQRHGTTVAGAMV